MLLAGLRREALRELWDSGGTHRRTGRSLFGDGWSILVASEPRHLQGMEIDRAYVVDSWATADVLIEARFRLRVKR